MARKTTTTIEEEEPEKPKKEVFGNVAVETIDTVEESAADRIESEMSREGAEPISRIYREDLRKNEANGREYLERVYMFAGEDYIAERYGGGRYVVRYQWRREGVLKKSSLSFAISNDCKPKTSAPLPESSPTEKKSALASFLDGLNAEKIVTIAGAVEAVKKIFEPKNDAMTELVKILAANRQQPVSDTIVIEALKAQRPPELPRPSLLTQIKEAREAIELLKDGDNEENNNSGSSETMNYVNMGMNILSMLLKQNNNDFNAVGQQVRENDIVNDLIQKDQGLAERFISAAREKYGDAAAKQLANGFGYAYGVKDEQPPALPETQENVATT